jgi:nitroreductase
MDVTEAIRLKRAVREFAPTPLPEDVVARILAAGRRAQSSKNTQPWHFIAIRQRQTLEALSRLGTYAGQAAAYMQLAAWELGVGSCIASIYEPEAARELLQAPSALHFDVALSFGYPAHPTVLSAPPRAGGRLPREESVHFERWTFTRETGSPS